jgi:hypothetical protein
MTRKTQETAKTQDPVTVRVRCLNKLHRVTWQDHRLVLENHSDNTVKFMDLLDAPCRCMEILRAIRTVEYHQWRRPTSIPLKLWKGIKFSSDTLYDRFINQYGDRYAQVPFITTPTTKLHFSTEAPQFTAWYNIAPARRLAIHRAQRWEVDWKAAQEYSEAPYKFIDTRQRCWPCNYRVIRTGARPIELDYLEHLRSPQHRERVFAAIAAIFEVSLPDDI